MEWVAALVAAALSLIAACFSVLSAWILRKKAREFVAVSDNGRRETVTVPPDASPDQVRRSIQEALEFEDEVGRVLREQLHFDVHRGKEVDFVASTPAGLVGVEVKTNLGSLNRSALRRYLNVSPELSKLVVVYRKTPSERLEESLKSDLEAGKVSFVRAIDNSSLVGELASELQVLH